MTLHKPAHPSLLLIGVLKLVKGGLLLIFAIGILNFLHRDVQKTARHLIKQIQIDPDNRYVTAGLAKLGIPDDRKIEKVSGMAGIYAGLLITEGIGLLRGRRWAEYLTVIATGSFVPLEVYEIVRHATGVRILLLVANLAIVGYLIWLLRQKEVDVVSRKRSDQGS